MPDETPKNEKAQPLDTNIEANDMVENSQTWLMGLKLSQITPDLAEKYQLDYDTQGLLIVDVAPDSDAEKKGLKKGNLILSIDKKPIIDIADVQNSLQEAELADYRPLLLQIKAEDQLHFVALKPAKEDK